MAAPLDLTGRRFGQLVVLGKGPKRGQKVRWACRCDCGNVTLSQTSDLTSGKSYRCLPCGLANAKGRHHGAYLPEYNSWQSMKDRCLNPNMPHFHRYGGRGITVCDRWRDSFANFLADMGRRPTPKHTLDRIDNDGPYSPENCRWATRHEQTRRGHRVLANIRALTHDGETMSVAEWAERKGIRPQTLALRLRRGWSVERALTTSVR